MERQHKACVRGNDLTLSHCWTSRAGLSHSATCHRKRRLMAGLQDLFSSSLLYSASDASEARRHRQLRSTQLSLHLRRLRPECVQPALWRRADACCCSRRGWRATPRRVRRGWLQAAQS